MTRLGALWKRVHESLWFVPGLCTTGAVLLSFLTVQLDRGWLRGVDLPGWILMAGAEGVRGVLSAIAGSLITVTGVVFSVTIVALQLASSQFTPRVLRNFISDRASQLVLGVFIGTFTYALLVLRVVRGEGEAGEFVPVTSVIVAVLLALTSIALLIFFIDHLARSIQVEVILDRVARQTVHTAQRIFPHENAEEHVDGRDGSMEPGPPRGEPGLVRARRAGYLQAVDERHLLELAEEHGLILRVEVPVGAFLLPGGPLVSVWPAAAVRDGLEGSLREGFVDGLERTPHQDVGRGILELADVAVKALSPSLNDPTTAIACVDRLAQVLLAVGSGDAPRTWRRAPDGEARLFLVPFGFEEALAEAYGPVAFYAAEHPRVLRRVLEQLARLASLLPPRCRTPLARMVDDVASRAEERLEDRMALARVRAAAAEARAVCGA